MLFKILTGSFNGFFRQLSRHLVGLWTAENKTAMNLLKRILVSKNEIWSKERIKSESL